MWISHSQEYKDCPKNYSGTVNVFVLNRYISWMFASGNHKIHGRCFSQDTWSRSKGIPPCSKGMFIPCAWSKQSDFSLTWDDSSNEGPSCKAVTAFWAATVMWHCCWSMVCGLLGAVAAFCAATSCDTAVAAWDVGWLVLLPHCVWPLSCDTAVAAWDAGHSVLLPYPGAAYAISSRVIWQDVSLFESSYWSAFIWKVTQVAFGTWDSIVLHKLDWCIVSGCVFLYLDCWMKLIQCLDVLKIDHVWLLSFIDWLHLSRRLHFIKACQMQAVAGLQKTTT